MGWVSDPMSQNQTSWFSTFFWIMNHFTIMYLCPFTSLLVTVMRSNVCQGCNRLPSWNIEPVVDVQPPCYHGHVICDQSEAIRCTECMHNLAHITALPTVGFTQRSLILSEPIVISTRVLRLCYSADACLEILSCQIGAVDGFKSCLH